MTHITEDSLCSKTFQNAVNAKICQHKGAKTKETTHHISSEKDLSHSSNTIFITDTPHNSIMSLKVSALKQYEAEESEIDITVNSHDSHAKMKKKIKKYNESSQIVSGGASFEDHLPQNTSHRESPLTRPIVSGAELMSQGIESNQRKPKPTDTSTWIVDMSLNLSEDEVNKTNNIINSNLKKPDDEACELLQNESKSNLDSYYRLEHNKGRSSVDSEGSEKSSHKFYIDLSSLPDPNPPKDNESKGSENNTIFSMYIDLGEKPAKEKPARFSSSVTTRRHNVNIKTNSKSYKGEIKSNLVSSADNAFEKYESLCHDPNISISAIVNAFEQCPSKITYISKDRPIVDTPIETQHYRDIFIEQRHHLNTKTTFKEQLVCEKLEDLFVKLSDLDKPVLKPEISATLIEKNLLDVRMTRSIPDNTWGEQNNPCTSKSIEVISSFHSENALSLNRLFPHLKNEFSRSMPGSLSDRTPSPIKMGALSGDLEEQRSETSEISSVQSSMCRSVIENSAKEDTYQISSFIGNCQSRLGQDLLRMFLQEIAPDVIVEVSGRRIKAHKCILSSRCQYFAGILSGGWVESAGNVIVLPPFSYNVVHFALCHIYSGLSTIPDTISIVELATIADMLGLESLKEAIMFTLKAKYCHNFHRPCEVCTAGVLECFPLSSVYGLDDLYRKCLKWITKYFSKVWPTKAFATLPKELLDKCYQQHIVNLSIDNLFDTVYGCGITVSSLQNSRWADNVARMCQRLVNAAAHFASTRLLAVLRTTALLPAVASFPAHDALDDCLTAAIEWAQPDEACRSYAFLSAIVKKIRTQQYPKPDLICNSTNKSYTQNSLLQSHASNWRLQCEGALVRNALRVVGTQAYKDLPPELQKRLRELGCIMYGAQSLPIYSTPMKDLRTKSTYITKSKPHKTSVTHTLDIDNVRASFVPYSIKPAVKIEVLKSNNYIRDVRNIKKKGSSPPQIRTTKAQEERAKYNLSKNNQSQDHLSTKLGRARIAFENTKPRYLEPRVPKEVESTKVRKNLVSKIISSSESSRNSSPIQQRNTRTSHMKSWQQSKTGAVPVPDLFQDSPASSSRPHTAEPSTDMLNEPQNVYTIYTKEKHPKGSTFNLSKCSNILITSNSCIKTKIPMYLKSRKRVALSSTDSLSAQGKAASIHKAPGSLMNATKSSSAKIVPKVIKEAIPNNSKNKKTGHTKHDKPSNIPMMKRSGTFLKDEPTFGEKTTNIDIDLDQ